MVPHKTDHRAKKYGDSIENEVQTLEISERIGRISLLLNCCIKAITTDTTGKFDFNKLRISGTENISHLWNACLLCARPWVCI
jgi:hypothetical protein